MVVRLFCFVFVFTDAVIEDTLHGEREPGGDSQRSQRRFPFGHEFGHEDDDHIQQQRRRRHRQ